MAHGREPSPTAEREPDPRESLPRLREELGTDDRGLSSREAARRLAVYGANEVPVKSESSIGRELVRQLAHPLALLLWAASLLAFLAGIAVLGWAIIAVIMVNAGFALMQERQAERAVETLARYLPEHAEVVRDGREQSVEARTLVPGDLVILDEGNKVPADARLTEGGIQADLSMLTGESAPAERVASPAVQDVPLLQEPDLVFSGTTCTGGRARGIVYATGSRTELGRIAALSQRTHREQSPLEHQVKRVAWFIAAAAVVMGAVFLVVGVAVGLPLSDALTFAIGLLVANVPEGLLPIITLALAVGVRALARQGAVVKRLSAVETLGSTNVICTDKTGTLTQNRMRMQRLWTPQSGTGTGADAQNLMRLTANCTTVSRDAEGVLHGDGTETALVDGATALGAGPDLGERDERRRALYRFDPRLRLMSVLTSLPGPDDRFLLITKGAPEAVLARATGSGGARSEEVVRTARAAAEDMARGGMRVLAVATRAFSPGALPLGREEAESELEVQGLVGLYDPPRPEVAAAVGRCHDAGLRVHIVTGDNGSTAAAVARQVGIGRPELRVAAEAEGLTEQQLDELLGPESSAETVFARSSPETKLRIADTLRHHGRIVAMTGDGVNDAPALHRAHIGVAMGLSGTDVAREAATMVLTDDNFATIVTAVESGRRVYDNVRKFIVYIFAHLVPEVVPFAVFALSGGAVPLPLTVLQILAVDLGTETLPALALGREKAEPGVMSRPPRESTQGVISRDMLIRSWGYLGVVSAALSMGAFFYVLWRAGWHPGSPTASGSELHGAYVTATTGTFAGIVMCQVGTAFAARTDHASLRAIGLWTNPLLLWGIAFELGFTGALIYLPPLQSLFGTDALPPDVLLIIMSFPFVVWGTDELRRARRRRVHGQQASER
ncbi:cation-transporting P-type ATPase [Streptomyces sp. NPDC020403]|uniref:cation-translocating P-type ATPase n=1 Tax=unclassified Streptomyces TaxID=2593676 RepID=UPI0033F11695